VHQHVVILFSNEHIQVHAKQSTLHHTTLYINVLNSCRDVHMPQTLLLLKCPILQGILLSGLTLQMRD